MPDTVLEYPVTVFAYFYGILNEKLYLIIKKEITL